MNTPKKEENIAPLEVAATKDFITLECETLDKLEEMKAWRVVLVAQLDDKKNRLDENKSIDDNLQFEISGIEASIARLDNVFLATFGDIWCAAIEKSLELKKVAEAQEANVKRLREVFLAYAFEINSLAEATIQ